METDTKGIYFTNEELETYFRKQAEAEAYINMLIRLKRVEQFGREERKEN
jgi:hypothetical protein